MQSLFKSPMIAQLERRVGTMTVLRQQQQKRTLMVPHVGQRNQKLGLKRVFVPRSQRIKGLKQDAKPTIALAHDLPLGFSEMDNTTLVTLGNLGEHEACVEMLKRHIMNVDNCDYDAASVKFKEISKRNAQGTWILNLPYKIGIGAALTAAFGSFPMVFELSTATWFNEFYVTTDVPEPRDLETMLEVGSWTWNVRHIFCHFFIDDSRMFGLLFSLVLCMH